MDLITTEPSLLTAPLHEPEADPRDRRGPFRPERLAPARVRLSQATLRRLFELGDLVCVSVLTLAVTLATAGSRGLLGESLAEVAPFAIGAGLALWLFDALAVNRFAGRDTAAGHLVKVLNVALVSFAGALSAAILLAPQEKPIVIAWGVSLVATAISMHAVGWLLVRRWRAQGRMTPNVVVVGATPNAARLIEAATATGEVAVLGIFDDRADRVPASLKGVPVLGTTAALLDHKILPYVDTIVITVTSSAQARVRELIERLSILPHAVTLFVEAEGEAVQESALSRMAEAPFRLVSGSAQDDRRALVKRVGDVVIAGLGFLAISPVLALIALAVRLDSPGPVLFRQRRNGFNNEVITVWKFRSMRTDATDHTATRQVTAGDDRVTRVGRFIRRTSLDELPQLLNVVRGEMSLVGPRPHAVGMQTAGKEAARLVGEYAWRHRMKPGITGWAQINGSRGPVHTAEDVRRRVALDVEYIERQSFWFDLYIILMTIPRLLGDKDAVR